MSQRPDTPISPGDASALAISPHAQPYVIAIGSLLAPGGFVDADGRPDIATLCRELSGPVNATPDLTQRAVHRGGRWWWVDTEVDLADHVEVLELDEDAATFGALCGRLAMVPLDPDRPLWRLTLVPQATPGHCGLILRIHHMLVDGARATAMLEHLFSGGQPDAAPASPAPAHLPGPAAETARPSLKERIEFQIGTVTHPRIASRTLLGTPGPTRDTAVASVDLAALQAGARAGGGTINDAYLVAAAQGLGLVIESGGDPVPETVVISAPVQVAGSGDSRNAVGFILVDVPVTATNLTSAIPRVAVQTRQAARVARASGPTFHSPWVARWFNWMGSHQHMIGAIASNVRGPRAPLTVAGAPLVELWPLGPLAGNVRVGFTAASYAGRFWIGVEVDDTHTPPAAEVAGRVQQALLEIAGAGNA